MTDEIRRALTPVAEAFEALGVRYQVGGSVASSVRGVARSTLDVDVVADLPASQVDAFVRALERDYYVDAEMIRDAIRTREPFNVIHLETMMKIDIFLAKGRAFDREAFGRASLETFGDADARAFPFTSAEDIVLHKLEWFRLGGGVSQRQWDDVLGVLKLQGASLDAPYLRRWAADIGVSELLERAILEAGGLA